ncbi:unnamed protein product [Schistosoma margrebowiei]|uniref:Uncharacterized protein n=1 Tax=Schistosoma margrebowiei TaxID=48269 RepID=A0A183MEB9_9TREM|nr:unnamed protein product [Schistosoma margrebowiei]
MLTSTLNPHSTDSNEESNHHHHLNNNDSYSHSPLIPPSLPLFTSSIINKQQYKHKHKLKMKLWIKQFKHYLRCMDYKRCNDIRLRQYLQKLIMFNYQVTSTSSTSSTLTLSTSTSTSSMNMTLSKLKKFSKMKKYFIKYNAHLGIRSKLKIDPDYKSYDDDRENNQKQIDDLELCRTINMKEDFDETMKKSTNQFRSELVFLIKDVCYIIDESEFQ